MGVQLSLKHPQLGLIQLPLVVHKLFLVTLQGGHHTVKMLGQFGQFIVPLQRDEDI